MMKTTKRLAWKQLLFKESVTAHWSMSLCTENVQGLKLYTEAIKISKLYLVTERSVYLRRLIVKLVGEIGSEHADMSSNKQ